MNSNVVFGLFTELFPTFHTHRTAFFHVILLCTVGSIPYNASLDDIKQFLSQVGPVLDFRLKTDPATGKSNGYGFCEYPDPLTAQTAIRQCLFLPISYPSSKPFLFHLHLHLFYFLFSQPSPQ